MQGQAKITKKLVEGANQHGVEQSAPKLPSGQQKPPSEQVSFRNFLMNKLETPPKKELSDNSSQAQQRQSVESFLREAKLYSAD